MKQGGILVNILDLFFPKRCLGCGRLGKYFCQECRGATRLLETSICPVCEKPAISGRTHPRCQGRYRLDGLTSFFEYDGVVQQAIKALKYRYVSDLAQEFIELIPASFLRSLAKLLNTNPLTAEPALVPIPLHPARWRQRGFNQAEILSQLLARRLGIALRTDILKRVRKTIPQVEMKQRKERLKNMERVFAVAPSIIQQYNKVILFDDVFTTGATLRSAAATLKRAGSRFVWGVTMAR